MKLLGVGDLHLTDKVFSCRTDDVVETQFRKLEYMLARGFDRLLVAGDFFDKPRSWTLLPRIINTLDLIIATRLPIMAVFGQHDTYLYSEKTRASTNLGVLEAAGYVKILNQTPCTIVDGKYEYNFYGCSYGQEIPIPWKKSGMNILVVHSNISDIEVNNQQYRKANVFLRENEEYDLIISGDQHRTFQTFDGERALLNSGPMLRKTSDLLLHEPGFWDISIDKGKLKSVEFELFPFTHYDKCMTINNSKMESEGSVELLDEFIESLQNINSKGTDFIFVLQDFLRKFKGSENVRKIISSMLLEKVK